MKSKIAARRSATSSARKTASARAGDAELMPPVAGECRPMAPLNAVPHGLSGDTVVLAIEDFVRFDELHASCLRRFQPADPIELDLVEDMSDCSWRIRRSVELECSTIHLLVYDRGDDLRDRHIHLTHASLLALDRVERYQTRLVRQYQRACKMPLELRKSALIICEQPKLPNEPNPIYEQPRAPKSAPAPHSGRRQQHV